MTTLSVLLGLNLSEMEEEEDLTPPKPKQTQPPPPKEENLPENKKKVKQFIWIQSDSTYVMSLSHYLFLIFNP